ncbi:MAG: hypothetical protein RMK49_04545 [Abditibacteriales bacterium]|nr:hypothetical protein [Abditibacteriales bacterium]
MRPAVKVTIDFGDGRVLKRTLMGNTVMYLCLPDGSVIDAFPGVYTPTDFLSETQKAMEFLRRCGDAISPAQVRQWHKEQVTAAIQSEKVRTTISKAVIESPLLKALGMSAERSVAKTPSPFPPGIDPIADPRSAFAALSARIEDLSKRPASAAQIRAAYANVPPKQQPTPEQLGKLAVEMDSRNNVTLIRPAVHLLFACYNTLPTPYDCRDVIFKQLLHVPIDDPYLGLTDVVVPGTHAEPNYRLR